MKLTKATAIILIGVLVAIVAVVAWGVSTFTQTIGWNYQATNASFTITNPSTLDYGTIIGETIKIENYTVTNNGNVPLNITASAIPIGSVTATWNQTTVTNLAIGASTTFQLTLQITGTGGVSITIAKA